MGGQFFRPRIAAPSTRRRVRSRTGSARKLPLKNLSPGSYILRVGAQSSVGGYATERIVPFEVR